MKYLILFISVFSFIGCEPSFEEKRKQALAAQAKDLTALGAEVKTALPSYKEEFPRTLLLCITIPQVTNLMGSQFDSERRSVREKNGEVVLQMRQYMGVSRTLGDVPKSPSESILLRINQWANSGEIRVEDYPLIEAADKEIVNMYASALEYLTANDNRNLHRIIVSFHGYLDDEFPTTSNSRAKELYIGKNG